MVDRELEIEHLIVAEEVLSTEMAAGQEVGEPVDVVRPHLVEWNLVDIEPEGNGLLCLGRFSSVLVGLEDLDEQPVAVGELELVVPTPCGCSANDAELLFKLAERSLGRGLSGLDPSARPIDLACPKSPLLANKEDAPFLDDEEQRGVIGGGPVFPVDRAESSAWLEGSHEAKVSSVLRAQPEREKW